MDMDNMNMNTAHAAGAFYGFNMVEYGDTGVGSMMALMTEHEPESESIMTTIPTSFSSYHAPVEGLLSAAMFQTCQGEKLGHFPEEHLMAEQGVISDSSLSSVKTEVCSNQLEFHRKAGIRCFVEPSPSSLLRTSQGEPRMVTSLEVDSPCSNNHNDTDALKTKIAAHPHYPRLVAAYMDCQKIGAPPEVVALLDEISQESHRKNTATMNIGADPELDQFMEAYCEMLLKYQTELAKPFKDAMAFINKIEMQLNSVSRGVIRNLSSACCDEREDGGGSSEDEFSGGEMEVREVDPRAEDKELKDQLLRKYSGSFSTLKREFLRKKKKGKLPKEARQKLLDWWNLHYKWPYPSETDKVALAETTGLDQKQINNWFINQRKRHWKPSEDMQFVVMDTLNPHSASFFMDGIEG